MYFRMRVPDGVRIVSAVPAKGGRIRGPATTELLVDGEGNAPIPGTIAQDVDLGSGRAFVHTDEREFKYVWLGPHRGKVNLAIGVQLAHARSLDQWFASWSEWVGAGAGMCRVAGFLPPHRGRGRS
jgi:hypothetical protein